MKRPDYICIDMDGVLVDMHTPLIRLYGEDPANYQTDEALAPVGEWGISVEREDLWPKGHFWDKIEAAGAQWWQDLPELPWTQDLWHAAIDTGASVLVLTTPAPFPACAAGKSAWCNQHLNTSNIMIGKPKYACAKPGSWLIDDRAMYCTRWEKEGGEVLSLKRPWNPTGMEPQTIIDLLRSLKKA